MSTTHISSNIPAPSPSTAAARSRTVRTGNSGRHALITAASLLATAGGWAWIAHAEPPDAVEAEPAAPAAIVEQAPAALSLAPIPTLVPHLAVQLPAAAPATHAAVRTARRESRRAAVAPTPALRQVDSDAAAAMVPTAAPQLQVAIPQAQVAPVQPAPITRTRSSRRRTR